MRLLTAGSLVQAQQGEPEKVLIKKLMGTFFMRCVAAQAKSRTNFSWMEKIYARDFDLLKKYAAVKGCVAAHDKSRTKFSWMKMID